MSKAILLFLALFVAPVAAVELNFEPLVQPRGESFVFTANMSDSFMDGSRVMTLTSGPLESFLDRVAPQHPRTDLQTFGYIDLRAADDWSVNFDGVTLTLTSPFEVRPSHYSDLIVHLVNATSVVSSSPPVFTSAIPEPETWASMGLMLVLLGFYRSLRKRYNELMTPEREALRQSLRARLRNMRGDFLGDGIHDGVRVSELLEAISQEPEAGEGLRVRIPTVVMEQEFQSHYRMGYEAGRRAALNEQQRGKT